jgi:hypothetical protein
MMPCWSLGLFGDDIAEAGFPDFAVECRGAQRRVRKAGLAQQGELIAAELLAAQLRRIGHMRIDQDGGYAGAAEHRRSRRAGEAATDDRDICVAHGLVPVRINHCARKRKKSLKEPAQISPYRRRLNRKTRACDQHPRGGALRVPMITVTMDSPTDLGPDWDDLVARASSNVFMNPAALAAAHETGFADVRMLTAWADDGGRRKLAASGPCNCGGSRRCGPPCWRRCLTLMPSCRVQWSIPPVSMRSFRRSSMRSRKVRCPRF